MQLLQKKLDEAVLKKVWFMLARNKMCKLTQDDITVCFYFKNKKANVATLF